MTSMPPAVSSVGQVARTTAESSTTMAVMRGLAMVLPGGRDGALRILARVQAAGPCRAPRRISTSPVARSSVTERGTSSPTSTPWSWKP
jgi:hypothetical protein